MRPSALFVLGLCLVGLPAVSARAQTVSVQLDARALDAIMDAEYGRDHTLSSTFQVKDLAITEISAFCVTATFDFVFSGTLEIPIPFARARKVRLYQAMGLKATFVPAFDGRKIEIPVKSLTVSYRDAMKMNLGNPAVSILTSFKRWLFSDQGKSLLERRLSIDLQPMLTSWFGKKAFSGKVLLTDDKLSLQLRPKP
jgi:hypothetical protein